MQANDAEGRKNDRLRKEKKRRGRNLTKVDRYLQGKRGVPTTGKFCDGSHVGHVTGHMLVT